MSAKYEFSLDSVVVLQFGLGLKTIFKVTRTVLSLDLWLSALPQPIRK